MPLGPVVPCSALAEDEVVRSENLTEGTSTDRIHRSWFEIDEHGSGDVLAAGSLIEVDVDSLQLEVGVAVVGTGRVDAMFVGDHLPELLEAKLIGKRMRSVKFNSISYTLSGDYSTTEVLWLSSGFFKDSLAFSVRFGKAHQNPS